MNGVPLIGLAAGGTGGHMFPAEALAQEMKRRGWRTLLFTDERGMRYAQGFPADILQKLHAANPNVSGLAGKAGAGMALARATVLSLRTIRRYRPAIIVGFGGYPSAPAMLAARLMRIHHGVHEQNAVLGRVNRVVAPKADFVAHAFGKLHRLPGNCRGRVVELGNPVRDAIREKAGAPFVPPAEFSELNLFVFGGSQGASLFSRIIPNAVASLPEPTRKRLHLVQQVREGEIEQVQQQYENAGVKHTLQPFFSDMPARLAAAHLIISRSGASSVTEIATVGRPAILVPLATAMDDHQTGNAQVLVDNGGAELLSETEFSVESLSARLEALLTDPVRLSQMATGAHKAAPEQATVKLADLVEDTAAVK